MSKTEKKQHAVRFQSLATHVASAVRRDTPASLFEAIEGADYRTFFDRVNEIDFAEMLSSDSFRDIYFLCELFSKNQYIDLGIDRAGAAVAKFLDAEKTCYATNRLFGQHTDALLCTKFDTATSSILWNARKNVHRVLPLDFDWNAVIDLCDFGPGANVGVTRREASKPYKIGNEKPTVTAGCYSLAKTALRYFEGWGHHYPVEPLVVEGGFMVTVPKSYKTDRVIMVEPQWNSFFQKGIGSLMKRLLLRVGVNLYDQTLNQEAARKGSVDGSYATIDLSAASDSISSGLVNWLLPLDWSDALSRVRTHRVLLPSGKYHYLEKFSSMGNAFTFELESLIFWSVCEGVRQYLGGSTLARPLVYGDDLAVDSRTASLVIQVLASVGFQTNAKKTHVGKEGFRESCGKHYLKGADVTPFYIRKGLVHPAERVLLCNNIRRYARTGRVWGLDGRFEAPYKATLATLPKRYAYTPIPDGFGDGGLVMDLDEAMSSLAPPVRGNRRGWDCWTTWHYPRCEIGGPKVRTTPSSYLAQLMDQDKRDSSAVDSRETSYGTGPSKESRYRAKLSVNQWPSYGPWDSET